MDGGSPPTGPGALYLSWTNVGLAFTFIVFDAVASKVFHLGLGNSIVTAAVRCIVQLVLIAFILQKVFESNDPWAAAAIACEHNCWPKVDILGLTKIRF